MQKLSLEVETLRPNVVLQGFKMTPGEHEVRFDLDYMILSRESKQDNNKESSASPL